MICLCLGVVAFFGLAVLSAAGAGAAEDENPVVIIDTSMGPITVELEKQRAPITVENFLKYVDEGYYNGLTFHRVIPDFMIQGGGFDDQMREKEAQHPPIKNEANNGLPNQRGTIAMARTPNPNSAKAQFFINTVDNTRNLGPGGVDATGYAVFGKVTDGMDAVDKIAKVQTARRGGLDDVPTTAVYIKGVKRKAKS
jgi:peptidyl-prolyl cis-trans isomerase A (cyclophilin A)